LIASALALAGVFTRATWPTADQIKVESCSPDGVFATLSATIHGIAFWRAQLTDIARRRERAENWDQIQVDMQARVDDIIPQSEENLDIILEKHLTDVQLAARRLRALADKIERDEANRVIGEAMRKQLPSLKQCEEIVTARLR
jgi:hypothetical protein